jgi:hypothetical protein
MESLPPLDDASCTGCWTSVSAPLPSPVESDARMVRFFRGQQDCVLYRDFEYEAEVRSAGDADEIDALPDFDSDPDYEIYWCVPTTEIFAYRFWTENTMAAFALSDVER